VARFDGTANLNPVRTTEEAKTRGSKGGRNSGHSRRFKKSLRECIKEVSEAKVSDANARTLIKKTLGVNNDDIPNAMLLAVSLFSQGVKGNTAAAKLFAELLGELVSKVEVSTALDETARMIDEYVEAHRSR